jgi:hypothetical protein
MRLSLIQNSHFDETQDCLSLAAGRLLCHTKGMVGAQQYVGSNLLRLKVVEGQFPHLKTGAGFGVRAA